MNINFDKKMQEIREAEAGKKLLLHSCCAPCSSYCLEELSPYFDTTVFYYNPNLDSSEEYARRKEEQIRLLSETKQAKFIDCGYDHAEFLQEVAGYEGEKEGGARCKLCFTLRLARTAEEAKKGGFDYFATTLTVSPLKNAALINELGFALAEKYGVSYLPSDFKKRGGYLRSVELSKEYGLYRQNYCGCEFGKRQ